MFLLLFLSDVSVKRNAKGVERTDGTSFWIVCFSPVRDLGIADAQSIDANNINKSHGCISQISLND
jgi:hypothetical protein